MIHGIDTDFLVAIEIRNHPFHRKADSVLQSLLADSHNIALAPHTLAEFIHIATDPKRMPEPLTVAEAINRSELWWNAIEVVRVFPDAQSGSDFFTWLRRYQLGRKRLHDTLLAATLHAAGINRIITNNDRDYRIFDCFEIVTFR